MIIFDQSDFDLLIQIGLTKTQAKVYLSLLGMKKANARAIFKKADVPRPEVYRSLDKLQKLGLVEKEITAPFVFKATPLDLGLQILVTQQVQQCREFQNKAKKIIRKIQNKHEQIQKHEYSIYMVEGRERLVQLIRHQHQSVQKKVDILSTLSRWMQILDFSFEDYEEALLRGVKYRVFIEDQQCQIGNYKIVHRLLSMPNFSLKSDRRALKTNLAIFDQEEITINFFPSQNLKDSPLIVTNHPSFISMSQDHFLAIWNKAFPFKLQNEQTGSLPTN